MGRDDRPAPLLSIDHQIFNTMKLYGKANWTYDNRDSVTVTDVESGSDAWFVADTFIAGMGDDSFYYALETPHGENIEPNEKGEYIFRVKRYDAEAEQKEAHERREKEREKHAAFIEHIADMTPDDLLAYYLAVRTGSDFNEIPDLVPLTVWTDAIEAIETLIESLKSEEE